MIDKNVWRSVTTAREINQSMYTEKRTFEFQSDQNMHSKLLYKKFFDTLLSGAGLILSSWLWVIIGIAIIMEDGFPVLIRQSRVGRAGKLFFSFKFRSMRKCALKERINSQAFENDHRITSVGRFLRKTALDELPQLLNIFLNDMSFVGPRALLPKEAEINGGFQYTKIDDVPGYEKRTAVYPGLTGIAQIYSPRDIPRKYKFKYDILYIKKMNLLIDIKLILLSCLISARGTWEKRHAKIGILKRGIYRT